MRKVTVSAPGKIHLSGEHSVVYGKPAVLTATSKRLFVTLENQKIRPKADQPLADTANSLVNVRKKDTFIDKIAKIVEEKYGVQVENDIGITINSDIPRGAGMGSSAALAVSLIGALTQWIGKPWNAAEINELAYSAEKHIHITPSGGDNTISTYGGILWYRKELEYLKTFWLLQFKIPKFFRNFIIIHTGRTEATGDLVKDVLKVRQKNVKNFTLLISQIEEASRKMITAIHDEDLKLFHEQLTENENLLEKMGVVSHATKKLIRQIEKFGGVAKISGAGGVKTGSGIVMAQHTEPKKLLDIAKKYNYPAFQAQFGGEGIKLEQVVT